MCTGLELLTGVGSALSGGAALKSAFSSKPTVNATDPAADAAKAADKAAQDAAKASLDSRRRARANSLLSTAYSESETAGKATLGA